VSAFLEWARDASVHVDLRGRREVGAPGEAMSTLVRGTHHITYCPARAQEDVDFLTTVLGQRLVKQTVLMDGRIPIHHLYYGNADADIGSITTSFPYSRRTGRAGSGQISATSYSVPLGSISFWEDHLDRHHVAHDGVHERFGCRFIRLRHPAGLSFELVETPDDNRRPWTTPEIGADVATRGFFGAVMSVREIPEQERFLVDALGLRKAGVDGAYHRFEIPNGAVDHTIDLHHEPDRAPGSWVFGSGTFHHIAFHVESDEALVEQKALYEELGYTDASEIKDRYYFHSMYVRSPGGILVECTSNVPGGFFQDEAPEELGTKLHLPPWYEHQRDDIIAMLEPLTVPEEFRPKEGAVARRPVPSPAAPRSASVTLSRTKAAFARKSSIKEL
jgi:glyoxalase family protein